MKALRWLALLVLPPLLGGTNAAAAEKQKVQILADDNYPPYSYLDLSNKPAGLYVDLINAVSARMKAFSIQVQMVPWKRGLSMVEQGEALAIMAPYFRPKSRPWIRPYSEPLFRETVVVVCRKDQVPPSPIVWPDSFFGKNFGNTLGFQTADAAFFNAVAAGQIGLEEAPGIIAHLRKLMVRRLDCYVNDRLAIAVSLRDIHETMDSAGLAQAYEIKGEDAFLGFSANARNVALKDAFVAEFNHSLAELRASGEAARIMEPAANE